MSVVAASTITPSDFGLGSVTGSIGQAWDFGWTPEDDSAEERQDWTHDSLQTDEQAFVAEAAAAGLSLEAMLEWPAFSGLRALGEVRPGQVSGLLNLGRP